MLCRTCRRQVPRGAALCGSCGAIFRAEGAPLELVFGDETRVPVVDAMTIGRAAGNTIQLGDPSVSRYHARIFVGGGLPELEDAGSSYGTWLDEREVTAPTPLRDGSRIQLGDAELRVEARRSDAAAGRTVVVPAGATLVVSATGAGDPVPVPAVVPSRPRIRDGWALKRLDAREGPRRYVLRDLRRGTFVRMSDDDASLFDLLDGERSLHDLVAEATARVGPNGGARIAALLADLGERGLLEGVEEPERAETRTLLGRLFRPRTLSVRWAGGVFEQVYRRGGFLLFTRPALVSFAAVAVSGAGAFAYLVAQRYGTPFVVAKRVGVGGLVFLLGRFLVVLLHELAHGLTVVSFGRRVPRAGLKLVLIFPYAFVDTSEAWFEPRRRRLAISAAGPASDLVVGGTAALGAAALAAGTIRDVLFQVALAAYIGAFFNLNPLLERDGYHMLVDLLQQPGLRRKSQRWLLGSLRGHGEGDGDSSVLATYAAAGLVWSVLMALFTIVISRRYYHALVLLAPRAIVWTLLGLLYLLVLVPIVVVIYGAVTARPREPADHVDVAV